ncbi:kinase-like protein [Clavulina sp. PMI_390]|nr:kinase-like protein [Clavulina sp. PMI_390]
MSHIDDSPIASRPSLSAAALWLSAFSPPTFSHAEPAETLYDEPLGDMDVSLEDVAQSPAAHYLRAFSSPPPSVSPAEPIREEIAGYELGRTLGHSLSHVRLATHTLTGSVVAVKISSLPTSHPPSSDQGVSVEEEEQIWSTLNHEYVLPLLSTHRTSTQVAFFTLYCPDGSLLDLLHKRASFNATAAGLEGDLVRSLFRQLCSGIAYLHNAMHIVHGDIKLENILIDDSGNARIADFGCAQHIVDEPESSGVISPTTATLNPFSSLSLSHPNPARVDEPHSPSNGGLERTLHASLPYASPELLCYPPHGYVPPAQPPQDIWAVGCVLHALLTGALPFADSYQPRLHQRILTGDWESRSITADADRVILRGCLQVQPSARWQISKLEARAHEVGAVDYAAMQDARSRSRSRTRPVPSRQSSSSAERSGERRRSRDSSRIRGPWPSTFEASPSYYGADPYSVSRPRRTSLVEEEEEDDFDESLSDRIGRRVRRALSSESTSIPSHAEPLTPTDDSYLSYRGFVHSTSTSRSRSRGRSSTGRIRVVAEPFPAPSSPSSPRSPQDAARGTFGTKEETIHHTSAARLPSSSDRLDPYYHGVSLCPANSPQ